MALISELMSYVPVGLLTPPVSQPVGSSDPSLREPYNGSRPSGGNLGEQVLGGSHIKTSEQSA